MYENQDKLAFQSKEQIHAFQSDSLQRLVSYVNTHSPYYRRLFKEKKINIKTIQQVEDLIHLPITTKEDLAKNNSDFICVPTHEIIDYITTSGTVGDPVTLITNDADLNRLAYNEYISFKNAGCTSHDIIQLMTTIDKRFMAGLAYFLGARKLGAGIIRVGAGMPELQWDSILRIKPTVLVAVPSFIIKLVDYAIKNNIDYKNCSIKKAICIGEPLRNEDFSLNTLGRKIKEHWDLELYSTYASTEMATAFTECVCGVGGHQIPELILVEFLDDHNKPVAAGQAGEVTITTLDVQGMPLIRYKTGDVVKHYTDTCACGRNTTRLGPVIGRKNQMIKYKGTTLFPSSIYDVLNNLNEIHSYLIEISTNEIGTDDILVKVSTKEKVDESFVKELKDHFRAKLRVAPSIEICSIEDLHAIQYKESLRKPILFIDKRTPII
ncbi:MAG: AMP-binding protein [Bacteroidota bacterium]